MSQKPCDNAEYAESTHSHPSVVSVVTLDLRETKCPLNFVKTRLALEKLLPAQVLEVVLHAESDNIVTLEASLQQEGWMLVPQMKEGVNEARGNDVSEIDSHYRVVRISGRIC